VAQDELSEDELAALIAREAGLDRDQLVRDALIGDLDLDLDAYRAVLVILEDRYDVEIHDLACADCRTLGDLMDRLRRYTVSHRTISGRSA